MGEIVVRGDNWNKPEATADELRGGWMHTGDGGYMDDHGYVFVVDRLKDMIVTDRPADALRGLLTSYSLLALRHPALVDLLIAEMRNLPVEQATTAARSQRDYVDEWVALLCQVHHELDTTSARVVAAAALTVVNDLVRALRLRYRPDADAVPPGLGRHVLTV